MTSFKKAFVQINKPKFRYARTILEIEFVILALEVIYAKLNLPFLGFGIHRVDASTYIGIANYAFILLTFRLQEKFWTQNNFRLLPIKSSKFVFANLLGTYLTWLFFIGCHIGLYAISVYFGAENVFAVSMQGITLTQAYLIVSIIVLILPLFITVFVSFIDLVTKTILAKSPVKLGKIMIGVLYAAITFVAMLLFNYLTFNVSKLFIDANGVGPLSIALLIGSFLVCIDIMWAVVTLVFNRYIESKK